MLFRSLHVASLDLNSSPTGGVVGTPSTLSATLVDLSVTPVAAVVGVSVHLSVGSQSCDAVTTASGVASCNLTPSTVGNFTLTASFAGIGHSIAGLAAHAETNRDPDNGCRRRNREINQRCAERAGCADDATGRA